MVKHFNEGRLMCFILFSESGNAMLIAAFYAGLKCFGIHCCDLSIREQGKSVFL